MKIRVVIISGSRQDLTAVEKEVVRSTLSTALGRVYRNGGRPYSTNTIVFHGNHPNPVGVDKFAADLFDAHCAEVQPLDAPWRLGEIEKYARNGPMRNEWLLQNALAVGKYHDVESYDLFCFPRNSSTGSINMLAQVCKEPKFAHTIRYLDSDFYSYEPATYQQELKL